MTCGSVVVNISNVVNLRLDEAHLKTLATVQVVVSFLLSMRETLQNDDARRAGSIGEEGRWVTLFHQSHLLIVSCLD